MLCEIKELPQLPSLSRLRFYRYSTHETQLLTQFSQFSSIKVNSNDFVFEIRIEMKKKSNLKCKFCHTLRCYKSSIAFWSHYVHKHDDISEQKRFEKIRNTTFIWSEYWVNHNENEKRSLSIQAKLLQTQENEFAWRHVLKWDLRWAQFYFISSVFRPQKTDAASMKYLSSSTLFFILISRLPAIKVANNW